MFNIHAIIILIRSIFHALDKYKIHQIQSRVLLKISQDAYAWNEIPWSLRSFADHRFEHPNAQQHVIFRLFGSNIHTDMLIYSDAAFR